jgi:hypothetical protein
MGFFAMQILLAGPPAITNIDVAPVLATACVDGICSAIPWCSTVAAQFDASSAQYVEARHS